MAPKPKSRPPADHKLMVTPGRKRLVISCTVCSEMAVDLVALTAQMFKDMESAHQLSIARKIIEPNVYP